MIFFLLGKDMFELRIYLIVYLDLYLSFTFIIVSVDVVLCVVSGGSRMIACFVDFRFLGSS